MRDMASSWPITFFYYSLSTTRTDALSGIKTQCLCLPHVVCLFCATELVCVYFNLSVPLPVQAAGICIACAGKPRWRLPWLRWSVVVPACVPEPPWFCWMPTRDSSTCGTDVSPTPAPGRWAPGLWKGSSRGEYPIQFVYGSVCSLLYFNVATFQL